MMSSDPDNEQINDSFKAIFFEAFKMSGLPFSEIEICDKRNKEMLADIIYDYNVILLAGGHVPTQNKFFHEIGLKKLLEDYDGLIIGISAGSMNSADIVYAQPELDGEAVDPKYDRYLEGLSLTNISILPHYDYLVDLSLDGLRVVEDISIQDSKVRPFYALVDGSYIFISDGSATLYGEAYYFSNGKISKVCEKNTSLKLY